MAHNEALANRVRESLSHLPKVIEKKMFRGITFMVNGKMCISVSTDEIMCRIGPEKFDELLEQPGCRPMVHAGRTMKGFVFVAEENIRSQAALHYWVNLCLEFNKKAKSAQKQRKK